MAEILTSQNDSSIDEFLAKSDPKKLDDARIILKMMEDATGEKPKMWGASLIGFGKERLHYASGRELDWLVIGFSPRVANFTLYVLRGGEAPYKELLGKLGKHKLGKGCLYFNKLADVDTGVLKQLIEKSLKTDFYTGKPL